MKAKMAGFNQFVVCSLSALLALATCACSSQSSTASVKKIPAGSEFSGYLSNYTNLKPNPKFERTLSYFTEDPAKNIHRYVAIIVEPVAVYVATDADDPAWSRTMSIREGVPSCAKAALAPIFSLGASTDALETLRSLPPSSEATTVAVPG